MKTERKRALAIINPAYCRDLKKAFADFLPKLPDFLGADLKKLWHNQTAWIIFFHSPEAEEVAKKYSLPCIFHPDHDYPDYIKDPGDPGRVFSFLRDKFDLVDLIRGNVEPYREGDQIRFIQQDGRYLMLEIDTTRKKQEIIDWVSKFIHRKPRGPALDFFPDLETWKMNKEQKKSPWKITQELHPELKSLTTKTCDHLDCEYITGDDSDKFCGKQKYCYKAIALLKNTKAAIRRIGKELPS